jgi:hypothetical protein
LIRFDPRANAFSRIIENGQSDFICVNPPLSAFEKKTFKAGLFYDIAMEPFTKKYFRLPRKQIGFLRFILESYDGLAFARTLDSRLALVEIAYPPSRQALITSLAEDLALEEAEAPAPGEYPPL